MRTLLSAMRVRHGQRGQTMVIFALAATFLIGIAGLAIEGGLMESDRRFEQAISDGAALAGAHKLPADTSGARKNAVDYAIAGLNGGATPGGCDPSPLYAADGPIPAACDPSPAHTLSITTPYNGKASDILVKMNRSFQLNLATAVGFSTAKIASRSVARSFSGGQPFAYALYASDNMTQNGNVDTVVYGNVYVNGCIELNNSDNLIVNPFGTQAGNVQVYDKNNQGPQVWNSATGTGCTANVLANTGTQWGAGGHSTSPVNTLSCGTAPNFSAACPADQQPVPAVPIPTYQPSDKTGTAGSACDSAQSVPGVFTTVAGKASPGCYSSCTAGGGSVTIPDGTLFKPGVYAFVGNGSVGSCNVLFAGSASNDPNAGGVTFILYNGASMCTGSKCGDSSAQGTITLSAPTSSSDPNYGILFYTCATTCGNGSGDFNMQGPHVTLDLTGLVYDPGGQCILVSNANETINGQVVCNTVSVQGGAVSQGSGVIYGGTNLPIPVFVAQLIE